MRYQTIETIDHLTESAARTALLELSQECKIAHGLERQLGSVADLNGSNRYSTFRSQYLWSKTSPDLWVGWIQLTMVSSSMRHWHSLPGAHMSRSEAFRSRFIGCSCSSKDTYKSAQEAACDLEDWEEAFRMHSSQQDTYSVIGSKTKGGLEMFQNLSEAERVICHSCEVACPGGFTFDLRINFSTHILYLSSSQHERQAFNVAKLGRSGMVDLRVPFQVDGFSMKSFKYRSQIGLQASSHQPINPTTHQHINTLTH